MGRSREPNLPDRKVNSREGNGFHFCPRSSCARINEVPKTRTMKSILNYLAVVAFAALLGLGCGGSKESIYLDSMDSSALTDGLSGIDGSLRGYADDVAAAMDKGDVEAAVEAFAELAKSDRLQPAEATACVEAATVVQQFIASNEEETAPEVIRGLDQAIMQFAVKAQ